MCISRLPSLPTLVVKTRKRHGFSRVTKRRRNGTWLQPLRGAGASPATTVQFHYDWRGRRDYVIDQDSNKTSYGYDDADRLLTVTDAQSPTNGVTT